MWNEEEKKSKVIGDNWDRGAEILYGKGHLAAIKAGRDIGKIKTGNGYTLQPTHFPVPVEIYRYLVAVGAGVENLEALNSVS